MAGCPLTGSRRVWWNRISCSTVTESAYAPAGRGEALCWYDELKQGTVH